MPICSVRIGGFMQFAPLTREWRPVTEHGRECTVVLIREIPYGVSPDDFVDAVRQEIDMWPTEIDVTVLGEFLSRPVPAPYPDPIPRDFTEADRGTVDEPSAYKLAWTDTYVAWMMNQLQKRHEQKPDKETTRERRLGKTPYILKQNLVVWDSGITPLPPSMLRDVVLLKGSVLRASYASIHFRGDEIYRRKLANAGAERFITKAQQRRSLNLTRRQSVGLSSWRV